jgi:hypothetical protein
MCDSVVCVVLVDECVVQWYIVESLVFASNHLSLYNVTSHLLHSYDINRRLLIVRNIYSVISIKLNFSLVTHLSPCTTCVVATCLPHSASRAREISPSVARSLAAMTAKARRLSGSAPLPPVNK